MKKVVSKLNEWMKWFGSFRCFSIPRTIFKVGTMSIKSRLWCPNNSCSASSLHEEGFLRPLLELPVDANHAHLVCPHCSSRLSVCDSCCSFIQLPTDPLQDQHHFEYCKKCGFPNLTHSCLRLHLQLPRISPLNYNTIRVLQASISRSLYIKYKSLELQNLQCALNQETADEKVNESKAEEFIIIPDDLEHVISAPSDSIRNHVLETNESIEQENSFEEEPKSQKNLKKRKRQFSDNTAIFPFQNMVESSFINVLSSVNNSKNTMDPPLAKRKATESSLNFKSSESVSPNRNRTKLTESSILELDIKIKSPQILSYKNWKSELKIDFSLMIPVLQLHLTLLKSSKCEEQDNLNWESMGYKVRAKGATPAHLCMLEALYTVDRPSSTCDKALWNRAKLFMKSKPSLLKLKMESNAAIEQTTGNQNWKQLVKNECLNEPSLEKVISGIFATRSGRLTSIFELRTKPHWKLLNDSASELKRLYLETINLLVSPTGLGRKLGDPHFINGCNSLIHYKDKLALQVAVGNFGQRSASPPLVALTIDEEIALEDSFELRRCMIALWLNMYRAIAAVVL